MDRELPINFGPHGLGGQQNLFGHADGHSAPPHSQMHLDGLRQALTSFYDDVFRTQQKPSESGPSGFGQHGDRRF